MCESFQNYPNSDDGHDYLTSGLALAERMAHIFWDTRESEPALLLLLNEKPWDNYACDGVADSIWKWVESMHESYDYWYEDLPDDHTWTELPEIKR